MANVKISDLPAASSAAGTDQLETNQSGTSRRLTVAQVATHVRSTATDTVVVAAGSASAPSISPTGDSNTGIFFPAADTIAFTEGGVEAMRIDSAGRVGIGTASPTSRLEVLGGTIRTTLGGGGPQLLLGNSNNTVAVGSVEVSGDAALAFYTSTSTERMRIDPITGNVGIGTSSPGNRLTVAGSGQFTGTIGQNSTGTHIWYQSDLSYLGAWGPNSSTNGTLVFYSARSDGSNGLERARIDSSGNTYFGSNRAYATGAVTRIYGDSVSGYARIDLNKFSSGTFATIGFYHRNNTVGSIDTTDTGTIYATSSDYRLKENVTPLTGAAARVQALKPSRFNFIADPDRTVDGFIAHEAAEVVPEAVSGEKDAVNEDGSIKAQGIDHSKLVPLLTAALQEALTEIASLKARVVALEAK